MGKSQWDLKLEKMRASRSVKVLVMERAVWMAFDLEMDLALH